MINEEVPNEEVLNEEVLNEEVPNEEVPNEEVRRTQMRRLLTLRTIRTLISFTIDKFSVHIATVLFVLMSAPVPSRRKRSIAFCIYAVLISGSICCLASLSSEC
jgi:hypothetical protein